MKASRIDRVRVAPLLILAPLLAGCGEVMFKRGAGPGAMQAQASTCRTQAGDDEDGYAACMRAHGYAYASGGSVTAFVPSATEASAAQTAASAPAAAAPAAAAPLPAAASPTSGPATTSAGVPAPAAPRAPTVLEPALAAAAAASDPLQPITVASWWKLGGTAAGLEGDEAACTSRLGVAHRPDPDSRSVTLGMATCLRGMGWFAVGR